MASSVNFQLITWYTSPMKKLLRGIKGAFKRAFKSPSTRKVTPFLVVFVIGAVVGGFATDRYVTNREDKKAKETGFSRNTNKTIPRTPEELAKRQAEQLDANYKRAKEDVAKDEKAGKITKEQSKLLLAKIDEIYNYRTKDLKGLSSAEARKKLSQKRTEWRKWATDNKLSTRYIIRLSI